MNADELELERRRWQAAFRNCDKGICCSVNTRHRPRCTRRAEHLVEHLAERRARAVGMPLIPQSIDYPEVDSPAGVGSGWWWIQFTVALLATFAAVAALAYRMVH